MLRPALAIAIPALGLALLLSHADPDQRAAWADTLRSHLNVGVGNSAVQAATAQPLHGPAPPIEPDTFTIYANGHGQFETSMTIAGRDLPALVDTGAFSVFLSFDAAASIGIHPADADFRYRITTANGETRAAPALLRSVRVGNVEARNVAAVVSMPGALATPNLLGMTFLNKLGGFDVQSGRLVLKQ